MPVKDRRDQMLRCLDALLAQDHASYEVLVLDNESSDGTPEACRSRAAKSAVPVTVEVVPGSIGRVRNRAGELARGEFVAFTDSDCVPSATWLTAAASALRADPRLGVVCGRTEPEVPIDRPWPATIEVTEYTKRFESCNVVFRRDALVGSAGFDESVGFGWEDTAAGFAVIRAGWRAAFVPAALVHHDVTYPGFRLQLARAHRNSNAPAVLRRYPELRRELFWGRFFLRSRNARFDAFLVGLILAPRWRRALLLTIPYLWMRRPGKLDPGHIRHQLEGTLYDGAVLLALVKGSIASRRLLL